MFQVFDKGYQITFANGLQLSVMFGYSNYCANRGCDLRNPKDLSCRNAELAVFDQQKSAEHGIVFANGKYDGGTCGWNTPEQIAKATAIIAEHVFIGNSEMSREAGYEVLRRKLRAALV